MRMNHHRLSGLLAVCALAAVSFLLYANSLHGDFLIDDTTAILENESIRDIKGFFLHSFRPRPGVLYEMLRVCTWQIARDNPFQYHLSNVIFHAACVVVFFFIVRALFGGIALSFVSSLIFAVHPINTEAVSWISAGHYPFSSLFFMLAFFCYIRSDRSIWYLAASCLSAALCVFSGNAFVMLPFVLLMYEVFFRPGAGQVGAQQLKLRRIRIAALAAVMLLAVASLGIYLASRNRFMHLIFYYRGASYLIVAAKAFLYYLKILYLPLARGLYHPFAFTTAGIQKISPAFFGSVSAAALAIVFFFRCRKKMPAVSFGIGWFLLTYLPYSNLIPVCNIVSERYLYLASAGLSLTLAALFMRAWEIINTNPAHRALLRSLAVGALTLFVGSYASLTAKRNLEYSNIITYWESNIRNFPGGHIVYNNLAGTFYAMGKPESAIAYCYINLMVDPRQPHVWCNLGKLYREKGEYDQAASCYREALKIDKGYVPALNALAALERLKEKQAVEANFAK